MVEFKVIKGSPTGQLVESTSRNVETDKVLNKITHSGVCYTDQVRASTVEKCNCWLILPAALPSGRYGLGT